MLLDTQSAPDQSAAPSENLPDSLKTQKSAPNHALDKKSQPPAFVVAARQHVHGRSGGVGIINIELARRKSKGVNTRGMSVIIGGPRGTRIASAGSATPVHGVDTPESWNCSPLHGGSKQRCVYSSDLARGQTPELLRARVAVDSSVKPGQVKISVKGSWNEDSVAVGQTGFEEDAAGNPTFQVSGKRHRTLTDGADLTVDPPISVKLKALSGRSVHIPASGGDDKSRTGGLVGTIKNMVGRDGTAAWRQTSGPTVAFRLPTTVKSVADSVAQSFVVPAGTPDGTKLGFELAVTSTGQTDVQTVVVTVRTHKKGAFAPRTGLVKRLAEATTRANLGGDVNKVDRRDYRTTISGARAKHVKPGATVQLKFNHPAPIAKVDWSVLSGRPRLLAKARKKNRSQLIFIAPKAPGTHLIHAVATLSDGRTISRTKIIKVDAKVLKIKKKAQVRPRALQLRAAAAAPADAASKTLFCKLTAGSQLTFADKSVLTLGAGYSAPNNCSATSSQAFMNATLTFNGVPLIVSGRLSGNGVVMSSGTLNVPPKLASYWPSSLPKSLTLTSPAAATVGVPLAAGKWGSWTGALNLNSVLNLVTLPAGWTWSTKSNTVQFLPGAGLQLSLEANSSDGSGGSVTFDMNLTGSTNEITVTAASMAVLQATDGDQISFNGTGTFYLGTAPAGKSNTVTLSMSCGNATACALASGLTLSSSTTLTYTSGSGLTLAGATLSVAIGANTYSLALSGNYTSAGNWTFTASATDPWAIGSTGVSLTSLTGTLSETPDPSPAPTSTFALSISADESGLTLDSALTGGTINGSVSLSCPAAHSCAVVAGVSVTGATATFLGQTFTFTATADYNSTSDAFLFDVSSTLNGSFGPAAMNITSATLTLTNENLTGSCLPTGSTPTTPDAGKLTLGVSATGTAYGTAITFGGDLNSDGYCLWGALGDYSQGSFAGNDVVLAYSSYAAGATLTLPSNAGDSTATAPSTQTVTVTVPASDVVLQGGFNLPASTVSSLGLPPGQATFTGTADVDLKSFTATADYTLDTPVFIVGGTSGVGDTSTTSQGLTLSDVSLNIGLSDGAGGFSASLTLEVDGDIVVASSSLPAGQSCPSAAPTEVNANCSYTPVGGSIGITVSDAGAGINMQIGVDSSTGAACSNTVTDPATQVAYTPQPLCVKDAFGQAGLDVANLAVSASVGTGGLTISFNGVVFLPSNMTSSVALINNPAVQLSFSISVIAPAPFVTGCIAFSIGEEDSGTTYMDAANAGVLTASYIDLVIAPIGCTVPVGASGSQTIAPGFAFAFDGAIMGDPVTINIDVSFQAKSGDAGMFISVNLQLDSFGLAGIVDFDATTVELTVNQDVNTPSNNVFSLYFNTGFTIGDPSIMGGSIAIDGYIATGPGDGDYVMVIGGNGNVNVADVITANVSGGACPTWTNGVVPVNSSGAAEPLSECVISLQQQGGKMINADVAANFDFSILGTTLSGNLDMIYTDGVVQDFHLGLGTSISFLIGDVSGTVYFDYCKGNLNTSQGSTDATSCTAGGNTSVFRVYLAGSYEIFWSTHNFSQTIVDTTATTPVITFNTDTSLADPGSFTKFAQNNAPTFDLDLLWDQSSMVGYLNGAGSPTDTVMMSSVGPQTTDISGTTFPGCATPNNGFTWAPGTDANGNPVPTGTNNPPPANANPGITAACAISVVYSTLGNADTEFGGTGNGVVPLDSFQSFATAATGHANGGQLSGSNLQNSGWFNTPQQGTVVCYPATSSTPVGCKLYENGQSLSEGISIENVSMNESADGTSTATSNSAGAYTQLQYGTLKPIGVLPGDGQVVPPGEDLWTADGKSTFDVQSDGNLALLGGGDYPTPGPQLKWTSQTSGVNPQGMTVNPDGTVAVVNIAGSTIWQTPVPTTAPQGTGNPYLFAADLNETTGGFWINDPDGNQLWGAIPPSDVFQLGNTQGGLCLYAPNTTNFTEMQVTGCNPSDSTQYFNYNPSTTTSGFGTITFPYESGSCLDLKNSGTSPGTIVDIYGCDGTDAQLWSMPGDGTVQALLADGNDSLCLAQSGDNVTVVDCSAEENIDWTVRSQGRLTPPALSGINMSATTTGSGSHQTTSVTATYTAATQTAAVPISGYTLGCYALGSDPSTRRTQVAASSSTSITLWGLSGNAPYTCYVQATSPNGAGAFTATYTPSTMSLVNGASNTCLNVPSGAVNFTQMEVSTCVGGSSQTVTYSSSGQIQLNGNCLDVKESGTTAGTVVDYYGCDDTAAQVWTFATDGQLTNPNSGLCLSAINNGTADGTLLDLETCGQQPGQIWTPVTPTVTPTAPTAPINVTSVNADTSATVSWQAPTYANGYSPVTSYTVTASPGGATCTSTQPNATTPPPTSCVVTGLVSGTTYTFSVTATNSIGVSSASSGVATVSELVEGASLAAGNQLVSSPVGYCSATMQANGDFAVYRQADHSLLWHSNTNSPGATILMQTDGNLVIYPAGGGQALWASGTMGNAGATVTMQDDCNLVVSNGNSPVWASGTSGEAQL